MTTFNMQELINLSMVEEAMIEKSFSPEERRSHEEMVAYIDTIIYGMIE